MTVRHAAVALLILSAPALGAATARATPTPTEPVRLTHSTDETSMATGPAGAMLESDYFQAPQRPVTAGRIFPCRLQIFDKVKLAQSCH
ncbi:hypothetical protein [Pseudolabrys taiwanensis]|nr:hypothetical protein [Pseudolabrys taiwanensis]